MKCVVMFPVGKIEWLDNNNNRRSNNAAALPAAGNKKRTMNLLRNNKIKEREQKQSVRSVAPPNTF